MTGGGGGQRRSGAKGAFEGALRPGEKKKLRKEKIQVGVCTCVSVLSLEAGGGDVFLLCHVMCPQPHACRTYAYTCVHMGQALPASVTRSPPGARVPYLHTPHLPLSQAKRSAREAARGFDVMSLVSRIADFVGGGSGGGGGGPGDVLALEPLGALGTGVAQAIAGVYGLRHGLQVRVGGREGWVGGWPSRRMGAVTEATSNEVARAWRTGLCKRTVGWPSAGLYPAANHKS